MNRIAAVITCRDLGRTLGAALESAERQTRPPAEIIIVDDASNEIYTRQVLAALERGGTLVVRTDGRGASAARNAGARLTSAEYLVWIDADDTLEAAYFEAAAALLDSDPALDFVSCALRAFEGASYVWKPAPPNFVDAISTGGVPHASTMVRRRVWETIGGFNETLQSFELLDFWASAIEHGFQGVILDEPLLNYRIRAGSGYRRSIQTDIYRARLNHFYEKHRTAVRQNGLEMIEAKEAFLLSQRDYGQMLRARVASLQHELAHLKEEVAHVEQALETKGLARVNWGDLRRREPISPQWGWDRGTPVDRYYIDRFLAQHSADIRGCVLEVRDSVYTHRFGGKAVTSADVVDIDSTNTLATIVADLRHADAIRSSTYDAIIVTQTLQLIDDMDSVVGECARLLKPGGVLLVTVPSVIRVDDEGGLDGDFWRLTEASARRLFAGAFPVDSFEVTSHGNVMACAAFLYGISTEEMKPGDLDHVDSNFPLVIAVRAVKPVAISPESSSYVVSGFSRTNTSVILSYHRIAELVPDSHALCTSAAMFRDHMELVRREFTPISLEDLVRAAAAGCIPERAIAITLDDGYVDALTTASPILTDLRLPATFFVNTERLDDEHERWWDILEHALSSDVAALEELNRTVWPLDAEARGRIVADVAAKLNIDRTPRPTHRVLTGEEIRRLDQRPGHRIGVHTTHHLALTTQPIDVKRNEVFESRDTLQRLLGRSVSLFAYPYGAFDGELVDLVRQAGFLGAVTVEPRPVTAGTNRLLLPRYVVGNIERDALAVQLQEIFEGRYVSMDT